jgi:hypothetical protein
VHLPTNTIINREYHERLEALSFPYLSFRWSTIFSEMSPSDEQLLIGYMYNQRHIVDVSGIWFFDHLEDS